MKFENIDTNNREGMKFDLIEVPYEELPEEVVQKIEGRSALFVRPTDYTERNFQKILKHLHSDGDTSYFAEQDKKYSEGNTEHCIYLVDTRQVEDREAMTGYMEIRLSPTSGPAYSKGKPFVGFTRTMSGFLKQGLARRRLLTANAYTLLHFGASLNSDTLISDAAERTWKQLVSDGLAKVYKEGPNRRYRFL